METFGPDPFSSRAIWSVSHPSIQALACRHEVLGATPIQAGWIKSCSAIATARPYLVTCPGGHSSDSSDLASTTCLLSILSVGVAPRRSCCVAVVHCSTCFPIHFCRALSLCPPVSTLHPATVNHSFLHQQRATMCARRFAQGDDSPSSLNSSDTCCWPAHSWNDDYPLPDSSSPRGCAHPLTGRYTRWQRRRTPQRR